MTIKRLRAAGALFCFALTLGACAPFSGYVADHVPHWAGGLPPDAPPRPGAPGYDEFIAHGEAAQTNAAPAEAVPGATPANAATGPVPANNAAASGEPQFQARNGQAQNSQAGTKQTGANQARNGKAKVKTHAAPVQASAQRTPRAEPADPVDAPAAEDPSAVKGGLY